MLFVLFYDKETNIFVHLLLKSFCVCLIHSHLKLFLYLDTMQHITSKDYWEENDMHVLWDGLTSRNIALLRI